MPPRLARLALAVSLSATAANAIGTALSPWLLVEHPLALVALSADVRHLVLAGGQVDFVSLWGVGTARRVLSMVSTYAIGAAYGFATLKWLEARWPRLGDGVRWLDRLLRKGGLLLLLAVPTYTLSAIAGAARMPLRPFLLITLIGQSWLVAAYLLVGEAVMGFTAPVLAWIKLYVVEATLATMAVVGLQQLWSWWRRRQAPTG